MAPPSDPGGQPIASDEDENPTEDVGYERYFVMFGFIFHTIAVGGDIKLTLERGELRVSSDVLMQKSPVFNAMLGPNFSEGQKPRSAANPLTLNLEDDDTESMAIFCVLLHKGAEEAFLSIYDKFQATPAATRLARLAIVVDKYAAVDHITDSELAALFGPFMNRRGEYELDLEKTSDLAVAAYLMHQGDLFSLFTRRLILDFNKQLSMLKYKDFATYIPAFAIQPQAEEDHWPPSYITQHTLRDVLDAIGTLGDYTAFKGDETALCREHKATSPSKAEWFEKSAAEMNKSAEGLCYVCTREDKHASECEHMLKLRHRMHELDPLDARP